MKPAQFDQRCGLAHLNLSRRELLVAGGLLLLSGCAGPAIRNQSPEKAGTLESQVKLVGDVAVPYGTNYIKIEGPALVTGLANTGSDPAPSAARSALLSDMQTRGVVNPNKLLATPSNSLVWVTGYLPPGVQKGDHYDLEVRTQPGSETTSLRGGWLMETRLKEMAVLGNQVRDGHLLGLGQGPLLVDPAANSEKDKQLLCQSVVLGGGVALKPRSLGLALKAEEKSVRTSSQIGTVLNRRFHTFVGGLKKGVAKPHTDEMVELTLHPKYKDNIPRYIRVCRSVALHETATQQASRIELLERQLLDPVTSATAALRLEAIGKAAITVLHKGLESRDAEVRFYSAEALAYLEDASCAPELAAAAKAQPAFRAFALAALSTLEDVAAYDHLRELLDVTSVETRYGAFRALRAMNDRDPVVRGERLGEAEFSYHVVASAGPPMVHVTKTTRPEIVLFGGEAHLIAPVVIEAGTSIVINAASPDQVTVSRFAAGESDQKRVVGNKLDEIIRAVVELGGKYPDVVQALQEAKAAKALSCRFEVDAIPQGGREYERRGEDIETASTDSYEVATPLPDLYSNRSGKTAKDRRAEQKADKKAAEKAKREVKRDDA